MTRTATTGSGTDALQDELFGAAPPALPPGMRFVEAFLSVDEEARLLDWIATLPLRQARYKAYTARRRVMSYGGQYDYDDQVLRPAEPIPDALTALRSRCAEWLGVAPQRFSHALVAQYPPGAPLGWHRDVPDFEDVVGVSLGGWARMRLRRYPPVEPKKADVLDLALPPRSAYVLGGEARWGWQHSIAPTEALRHSITFRTPRDRGAR